MGTVQESWQERREQILQAAMEVLVDVGASDLTIRKVAKAAGVDPALIYHYFSSKDDLIQEVTSVPMGIMADLSDPQRDLAGKLSALEQGIARLWISSLMVCMADTPNRGRQQFDLVLDHLVCDADPAKRAMVVGLLFERYLLHATDYHEAVLQRYKQLVEAV